MAFGGRSVQQQLQPPIPKAAGSLFWVVSPVMVPDMPLGYLRNKRTACATLPEESAARELLQMPMTERTAKVAPTCLIGPHAPDASTSALRAAPGLYLECRVAAAAFMGAQPGSSV